MYKNYEENIVIVLWHHLVFILRLATDNPKNVQAGAERVGNVTLNRTLYLTMKGMVHLYSNL